MKTTRSSQIYDVLAVLSVTFGPICLLVQGDSATSIEKFLCIVSIVPLGLIASQVRFLLGKSALMETSDFQVQRKEMEKLTREHKQLSLIVLIGGGFGSVFYAWIIFGMPGR